MTEDEAVANKRVRFPKERRLGDLKWFRAVDL